METIKKKHVLIISHAQRQKNWGALFEAMPGYAPVFTSAESILADDFETPSFHSCDLLLCDLGCNSPKPDFLHALNAMLKSFSGPRLLSAETATASWAEQIQAGDGMLSRHTAATVAERQLDALLRSSNLRQRYLKLRQQRPLGQKTSELIAAFITQRMTQEASVVWLGLANVTYWQERLPPGAFSDLCQSWFQRIQRTLKKFSVLRLSETTAVVLATTGHDKSRQWFSRLREAFQKQPFTLQGQSLVTELVGIAFSDFSRHEDIPEWLREAETRLGQLQTGAKGNTAKGLSFVAESADDKAYHLIRAQLQQAIAERRITWLYQPFVGKHEDGREKYQLMMRVVTSAGKELAGKDYLGVAKRSGLLEALDAMGLEQAIRWLHQAPADQSFSLLVNQDLQAYADESGLASRRQLIDTEMGSGNPGAFSHQLVIQFDTGQAVLQMAQLAAIGEALHQAGVTLCLSGFRNEKSHWQAAKTLQADWVRCDSPGQNPRLYAGGKKSPFASLVKRAHNRNLKVLVPQVDTMEMMANLWSQDVDYLQGYFIQRPTPDVAFSFEQQTL